jgi:phage baseplate assembly protein W
MLEMDMLFNTNNGGFIVYEGAAAVQHRLENWCATPRGSLFGKPAWGHTLTQFLHEPPTDTLASVIETELVIRLGEDLPEVELQWVRVEPSEEFDAYRLQIGYRTDELLGVSEVSVTRS